MRDRWRRMRLRLFVGSVSNLIRSIASTDAAHYSARLHAGDKELGRFTGRSGRRRLSPIDPAPKLILLRVPTIDDVVLLALVQKSFDGVASTLPTHVAGLVDEQEPPPPPPEACRSVDFPQPAHYFGYSQLVETRLARGKWFHGPWCVRALVFRYVDGLLTVARARAR